MKMLPVQLSLNPPLGLWSDVLWRCPPAPPSQLAELKTQLPPSLPSDPRLWGREDVSAFLRFCEREFDLPKVDYDLFQMNGKALCLLTRADFGHRCPGAGDVLHNVLQMLIIESHMMQWHLPNSPVTPTSRYPLSPHSHPPTPTWPPIPPPESPFHSSGGGGGGGGGVAPPPHLHQFMAPNSVTLSPPPSVDSQASSPPQQGQEPSSAAAAAAVAAAIANASNSAAIVVGSSAASSSSGCSSAGSTTSSSNNNNSNSHHSLHHHNVHQHQQHQHQQHQQHHNSNNSAAALSAAAAAAVAVAAASNAFGNVPQHQQQQQTTTTSTSSNQSDSDEESYSEAKSSSMGSGLNTVAAVAQYNASPPPTPILKDMPQSLTQKISNSFVTSWSQSQQKANGGAGGGGGGGGGGGSAPTTPSYMQTVKREFFPETTEPNTNGRLLWDFLQQLLNDRNHKYSDLIAWKCRDTGVFKIVDPAGLAKLWGIQKNHLSMNYDKMSRALRYYYRVNILRKVQGERHCYQFLRNPTELKNIKNISLLRQSVNATGGGANGGNGNGNGAAAGGGGGNGASIKQESNANVNAATNWSLAHLQQAQAQAQASQQQQQQQQQQQAPQSPSSRSSGSNGSLSHSHSHSHLNLPAISPSAAAAAVAAAAAAAYGPPPSSPLFMHAINGAFHYLSSTSSAGPPPNSPAQPPTPSEKFQFSALKLESNGGAAAGIAAEHNEEMKPTDLSVGGSSEKRPYSSPSTNDDCFPLIRNADGLTTIKLIRYNDNETASAGKPQMLPSNNEHMVSMVVPESSSSSSPSSISSASAGGGGVVGSGCSDDLTNHPAPMPMESDSNSSEAHSSAQYDMLPTDLRK